MVAPSKLPDVEVLIKLKNDHSYQQIADMFGVHQSAVYQKLRNTRAVKPRANHSELIPWYVSKKHDSARPVRMLRLLGRRQKGEELRKVPGQQLDKWLRELNEADVVVCYDPNYPPNPASELTGGFYYEPRTRDDGDNVIRFTQNAAGRNTG
jgi:hypothetical protein